MPNSTIPSVSNLKRAIEIAEKIESLQAQLAALVGGGNAAPVAASATSPSAPARKGARSGKRYLSPEARERIAAAQRARWAKAKGTSKPAAQPKAAAAAKPAKPAKGKKRKSGLTPAGRAKLAAAMKARWAARKKGAPAPTASKK